MSKDVVLQKLRRAPERRVREIFRHRLAGRRRRSGLHCWADPQMVLDRGGRARFVGKPYVVSEARLTEEFSQTKVRTVFPERWQRADESIESDTGPENELEDIETVTIAHARRRELAGVIAEITTSKRRGCNSAFRRCTARRTYCGRFRIIGRVTTNWAASRRRRVLALV